MALDKNGIAQRIAQELKDGWYVNLGIGIPTLVANYRLEHTFDFQKRIEIPNATGYYSMLEIQILKQTKKQDDMCLDEATGEVAVKTQTQYELDSSKLDVWIKE